MTHGLCRISSHGSSSKLFCVVLVNLVIGQTFGCFFFRGSSFPFKASQKNEGMRRIVCHACFSGACLCACVPICEFCYLSIAHRISWLANVTDNTVCAHVGLFLTIWLDLATPLTYSMDYQPHPFLPCSFATYLLDQHPCDVKWHS